MGLEISSDFYLKFYSREEEAYTPEPFAVTTEQNYGVDALDDFQILSYGALNDNGKCIWGERPSVDKKGIQYRGERRYSIHDLSEKPDPISQELYGITILKDKPTDVTIYMKPLDNEMGDFRLKKDYITGPREIYRSIQPLNLNYREQHV